MKYYKSQRRCAYHSWPISNGDIAHKTSAANAQAGMRHTSLAAAAIDNTADLQRRGAARSTAPAQLPPSTKVYGRTGQRIMAEKCCGNILVLSWTRGAWRNMPLPPTTLLIFLSLFRNTLRPRLGATLLRHSRAGITPTSSEGLRTRIDIL